MNEKQIDALAEIKDPEVLETTSVVKIAEIEAPWAIDANGNALDTSYRIEDNSLIQTVLVDDFTVFPVIVDPSVRWWVTQALKCTAGVATTLAFGPAKVATVSAKIYKIVKFGKTIKLRNALANWNYLGRTNVQRFQTLVQDVKRFGNDIISTKGNFKLAWARMSKNKSGDQAKKFIINTGTTPLDLIGLNGCYQLYRELSS